MTELDRPGMFLSIAVGALLVVAGFFHQRLAREHLRSVS